MNTNFGFVRVAAAVPTMRVADCRYNAEQIKLQIDEAISEGVEVICFPELSITGYSCACSLGNIELSGQFCEIYFVNVLVIKEQHCKLGARRHPFVKMNDCFFFFSKMYAPKRHIQL